MSLVFNLFKKLQADGTINLSTDTLKAMLVGSTFTANADMDYVNPSAYQTELSGTNYAGGYGGSGRKTITSKTFTEDDTNDRAAFNATATTWSAINAGTAAGVLIIRERAGTGDTMSELICFINDGGFPVTTNGGDLTITWNDILRLT